MSSKLTTQKPGLSYNDFRASIKGTGNSPSQISALWKDYKKLHPTKRSPRRSPKKVGSKGPSRSPKKATPSPKLPRTKAHKDLSKIKDSNIGPSGLPMSPVRTKRAPFFLAKKKEKSEIIMLYLEAPDALKLANMMTLKKLFQVMAASSELRNLLITDRNFWFTKYRNTFGYTQEFMMTKSTDPQHWLRLTKARAIKLGM